MITPRIILFARFPAPGIAKTRMIPALGAHGAAALHRHLVEKTLETIRAAELPFAIHVTGAPCADFADWLGGDIAFVDQGAGDLGERLVRVAPPTVVIGADAPDLSVAHLRAAAAAVAQQRIVIGPAEDGGYYLIGYPRPVDFLFDAMPWGSDAVFGETMARLERHAIAPVLLAPLADLDRPEDLDRWPHLMTAFPPLTPNRAAERSEPPASPPRARSSPGCDSLQGDRKSVV